MSEQPRTFPLPKHWRKACQGKYLGEWNLFDDRVGKHIVVELTIDDKPRGVNYEEVTGVGGKKEACLVLRFKGKNLPFILTTSNGRILAAQFGTLNPDEWHGRRFKLGTEYKKVRGGMAHVLRVVAPSARGQELKETLADLAPAVDEFDGVPEDPDEGP